MSIKPTRYHPLLVAIHWISAILIIFMLSFGTLVLARMPNAAGKLLPLTLHMVTGLLILLLTIARFIVRLVTPKPEPATIGNRFLDLVGRVTHGLLYLGAFGMGLSGLVMGIQSGLFRMIVSGDWTLVGGFYAFTPRVYHHYFALAMDAIILLHIGAALVHQVFRKDNLIARMSFGRKSKV
jgi:cytochrome b561